MVKHILDWGWPDEDIEKLIEAASKIEGQRMHSIFEKSRPPKEK